MSLERISLNEIQEYLSESFEKKYIITDKTNFSFYEDFDYIREVHIRKKNKERFDAKTTIEILIGGERIQKIEQYPEHVDDYCMIELNYPTILSAKNQDIIMEISSSTSDNDMYDIKIIGSRLDNSIITKIKENNMSVILETLNPWIGDDRYMISNNILKNQNKSNNILPTPNMKQVDPISKKRDIYLKFRKSGLIDDVCMELGDKEYKGYLVRLPEDEVSSELYTNFPLYSIIEPRIWKDEENTQYNIFGMYQYHRTTTFEYCEENDDKYKIKYRILMTSDLIQYIDILFRNDNMQNEKLEITASIIISREIHDAQCEMIDNKLRVYLEDEKVINMVHNPYEYVYVELNISKNLLEECKEITMNVMDIYADRLTRREICEIGEKTITLKQLVN